MDLEIEGMKVVRRYVDDDGWEWAVYEFSDKEEPLPPAQPLLLW